MTKSAKYVHRMLQVHKKEFDEFKVVHDNFALNQTKHQNEFNKAGEKIREICNEWENKLCKQSEKGGYSHFTPKLAESFRAEVRKHFSMIDHVGVKVSYDPDITSNNSFILKKISL
ncbi:hypothetical protein ACFL2C_03770 [Patescibacteria group bacterium]